jgi:peptidoglycan/LPS O-acetylase OafA/YrhL
VLAVTPASSSVEASSEAALRRLVEAMKGIAILLVIGVHVRRGWFGWQGVHVFVVLSGATLALSAATAVRATPWRDWYVRRAARILPAYWLTAGAGFLVALLLGSAGLTGRSGEVFTPAGLLARDVALVRNLDYSTMFGPVNASLWYVPMLAGLYLLFPPIMTWMGRASGTRGVAGIVAGAAIVELSARAAAVVWLDGIPVGYGHGFWPGLGAVDQPLDALSRATPFQLWAPFGLFPSRLGEFVLGMAVGLAWARQPERVARVASRASSLALGAGLWLAGSGLAYFRTAWAVADLLIAAGLTMVVATVCGFMLPALPRARRWLEWLGGWSYDLFLLHVLVGTAAATVAARLAISTLPGFLVLGLGTVVALVGSCRLLRAIDTRIRRVLA